MKPETYNKIKSILVKDALDLIKQRFYKFCTEHKLFFTEHFERLEIAYSSPGCFIISYDGDEREHLYSLKLRMLIDLKQKKINGKQHVNFKCIDWNPSDITVNGIKTSDIKSDENVFDEFINRPDQRTGSTEQEKEYYADEFLRWCEQCQKETEHDNNGCRWCQLIGLK